MPCLCLSMAQIDKCRMNLTFQSGSRSASSLKIQLLFSVYICINVRILAIETVKRFKENKIEVLFSKFALRQKQIDKKIWRLDYSV